MQISVETTSELSRRMTVSLPEDLVQEKMAERLMSLAGKVKIDGFRPGKAPRHIVSKLYGNQIRGEVTEDLMQSSYADAIKAHNLKPAGQPYIDSLDDADGVRYTAVFEVYPEFNLDAAKQLRITRPTASVEEHDVDAMVEKLRLQKATWHPAGRPAQTGDKLTIHFSGTVADHNFTGGQVQDHTVEIGGMRMIPGFEDNLVGLGAGERKTFTLTFPENHGAADLAGKEAQFEVEVVGVEAPLLPEVNDDFIRGYGIDDGGIAAFRADIRANLERELGKALRNQLKDAVLHALHQAIPISVPNVLVEQEIRQLAKPYVEQAKRQKLKLEDLKLPREAFAEHARRRVALGLLIAEIIDANNLQLDQDRVRAAVEDLALSYEHPEEVVNWYYADNRRLHDVEQMVLEDQVVDWLAAHGAVVDQPTTFAAIMAEEHS